MTQRDLSPIERDEDFVEFPVDRCVKCGAVIGKDEAHDDVCDVCAGNGSIEGGRGLVADGGDVRGPSDLDSQPPAPFGMCAEDGELDDTLDNQRVA